MKRPVVLTALALIFLLLASACEQSAGTGDTEPITLSSAADLAKIGADPAYPLDGDYTLGANLILTDWTPIGTSDARFTGTFNGNGKTLTITGSGGVFGFVRDAVISKVTVAGTITRAEDSGAAVYVGGIAGFAESARIDSCVANVTITVEGHGHNSSAGGIAGFLSEDCVVADCRAAGTVTLRSGPDEGLMLYAGGVAGYQGLAGASGGGEGNCVIERCSFTGSVTVEGAYPYSGGVAGYNYAGSVIRRSWAAEGTVTAAGENLPYAGGVAGYNSRSARIEDCYANMTVNAVSTAKQALAGGVTGANAADSLVSRSYALGTVTATVDGSSAADAGGSIGVPAKANAGGIAGAQYFNAPSIEYCVALNTEITGTDSGSGGAFNVRRIAGGGTGGQPAWMANKSSTALAEGGTARVPLSDPAGEDGEDCAAKPDQSAYEVLEWDFDTVWTMGAEGYPVLQ
jgi:hypothetical protein